MRTRGLALALPLLLVTLAGCLSDVDAPLDTTDDVAEEAEPFVSHVTLIDPDSGIGEPSLGVTPDGVLFTYTSNKVWRSSDSGVTWDDLGNPMTLFNFDPHLTVDPDGVVWYDTLWIGCTEVAVSSDLGETWSTNPLVCGAPASDRQYTIATGDCTAYTYAHQLPSLQQTFAKTTDCGITWIPLGSSEVSGSAPRGQTSGWGGGGFFNPATGSVWFTWSWFPIFGLGFEPGYAVTKDGGLTWTQGSAGTPTGTGLGLSLVVGAADEAGNVYIAWGEQHNDDVGIYVAGSQDDGETWTEPVRFDTPGTSKVFPAITAGTDGEVAVAYYESDKPGAPFDQPDDSAWNVTLAWTTDFFTNGADGIMQGQLSDHRVKTGNICPNGTTCQGDREFLDFFEIERLPDGRIGATYNSMHHTEDDNAEGPRRNIYAQTNDAILSPWGQPATQNATGLQPMVPRIIA